MLMKCATTTAPLPRCISGVLCCHTVERTPPAYTPQCVSHMAKSPDLAQSLTILQCVWIKYSRLAIREQAHITLT